MAFSTRRKFNGYLLENFIGKLDLNPSVTKSYPITEGFMTAGQSFLSSDHSIIKGFMKYVCVFPNV